MPHIVLFIMSWILLFTVVKKERITRLSIGGLIGAVLAGVVDYFGNILALYRYKKILLPIVNGIPIYHLLSVFAISIIYLDRLPKNRTKRLWYTVYFSGILIAVEAIMYMYGAITYINWKLWYSYFLDFAGLSILAFLNDRINIYARIGIENR